MPRYPHLLLAARMPAALPALSPARSRVLLDDALDQPANSQHAHTHGNGAPADRSNSGCRK